ncbi:hypothetical protein [Leptolyngbya sp. DQ-M1]|uniref:hypothetical protein n=1 Tax=Leptolyngbya sp. DQ-M1 TaxID=2933920 RepID=UPI00329824CC
MMTEPNDRLNSQEIKAESETRTARIFRIIQSATVAVLTELKAGTDESSTHSQTTSTAGQNAASEKAKAPFRTTATQTQIAKQIKSLLLKLDAKLTDRYGDAYHARLRNQYATIQQRLEQFRIWYAKSRANAATIQTAPLQQKQAEIELKVADQGTLVARKEQQIRQQIKQRLSAAIRTVQQSDRT